jgi:hypothetical protein
MFVMLNHDTHIVCFTFVHPLTDKEQIWPSYYMHLHLPVKCLGSFHKEDLIHFCAQIMNSETSVLMN